MPSAYSDFIAVTNAINHGSIYKFFTKPWDDGLMRANVQEAFQLCSVRCARDYVCNVFTRYPPDAVTDTPFAALVYIADILCCGPEIGNGRDSPIPGLDIRAMARLSLEWEELSKCLPEIEALNADANVLVEN